MPLFSHYEPLADISDRLSIPSLVFCILTPLIVLARFLARCLHGNQLGADDWTILASLVFAQTVNIQMIICCQWGFGKHTREIPRPIVEKTLELYFYAQILYKINIGLTKISILMLYLRVFGVTRWFKILCWVVIGIVIAFTTASVTTSIFQCSPVKYAYDKSGGNGTCIDLTKFWYGNAGYNIGTDLIIITMPALVIRLLRLPKRTKLALMAVFGLGALYASSHPFLPILSQLRTAILTGRSVCVTSIFRFTTLNLSTVRTDSMWQSIDSSMWTIIESNLAIIVACMPALRRPIAHFFPALVGKNTAGSGTLGSKKQGYNYHNHYAYPHSGTKASTDAEGREGKRRGLSKGDTWILDDDDDDDDDELAPHTSARRTDVVGEGYGYDMHEIGESDRGSDVIILQKSKGQANDNTGGNSGRHIVKTTEVRVEDAPQRQHFSSPHRTRNREHYYPR